MIFAALFAMTLLGGVPNNVDCESPRTQLAMNECAAMKVAKADERLNNIYRRYLGRLEPKQQERLAAAQRVWLAFRTS